MEICKLTDHTAVWNLVVFNRAMISKNNIGGTKPLEYNVLLFICVLAEELECWLRSNFEFSG